LEERNNKHPYSIHFSEKIQNNCEKKKKDIIPMSYWAKRSEVEVSLWVGIYDIMIKNYKVYIR
jgi:hypothetical protein